MATDKGRRVHLRFSAEEVEAWRLDGERAGFPLATFLKARIRDGSHYADLTKQIHALREDRRRDVELLKVVLAVALEGVLHTRELAYPSSESTGSRTAADAAIAAKRAAARETAMKTVAAIYERGTAS